MDGGMIRTSFSDGDPLDLPGSHETVHVFHGITMPWKPIAVKFIAPQPNLFGQLSSGQGQFLRVGRQLASDAVAQQINPRSLKCFSCGNAATGFVIWNCIYVETADVLKWKNYGACGCDNDQCFKTLDERIMGWLNTGATKVCEIE